MRHSTHMPASLATKHVQGLRTLCYGRLGLRPKSAAVNNDWFLRNYMCTCTYHHVNNSLYLYRGGTNSRYVFGHIFFRSAKTDNTITISTDIAKNAAPDHSTTHTDVSRRQCTTLKRHSLHQCPIKSLL